MMSPRIMTGTAMLVLLCAGLARPVIAATISDEAALDTVLVETSRAKLGELRQQLLELEDRFLDRYNRLNTVPDFDVHCGVEAPTGTRLKGRFCRAVYENRALEEEGRRALQLRQFIQEQTMRGIPDPIVDGGPPVAAAVAIEMRRPEFRKNMREITLADPGLQQLLRERHELGQHYDAMRRKVFGREHARKGASPLVPASVATPDPG